MGSVEQPSWKHRAAEKRALQAESIPKEWRLPESALKAKPKDTYAFLTTSGLLTESELDITETTDCNKLLVKLASGKLSAVAVTDAFCKRAAIAQQLVGCCTEMFFQEAHETAKALDAYLAREGKTMGPLHGLPISIKDCFDVKGYDSTVGWVGDIGKPKKEDDILVQTLRAQGAVLYVKTNIPQSLMMSDSYNHVFKQSVNAFHNGLISGGSSGGEGAIVGSRGSIIGIGTDIGGSVRIPAALQGLFGLNPTTGRVAFDKSGMRGYIVPPVAGPITTDLSSLETFMDGLCAGKAWQRDPVVVPLPWRRELAAKPTRPLRIGYYVDDGIVRVQPPHEQAINKAVAALIADGHEVFKWDTSEHADGYNLWLKAVLADGGRRCRIQCELMNEPLIEGMLVGQPENELSVVQGEELHQQIRDYQKHYLKKWHDAKLDALIMPVTPFVGFKPKTWVKSSQYVGYTAHWNLLDWAAITVPVETANPEAIDLDAEPGDGRVAWRKHQPRNESDRFNWAQYDPDLIRGMPVCAQVVGGRYGEENSVAVAKVLVEALQDVAKS